MTYKLWLSSLLFLLPLTVLNASTTDSLSSNAIYFHTKNWVNNVLNDIENPIRIYHYKVKKVAVSGLQFETMKGNFAPIDAPQTSYEGTFNMLGIQQVGRFSLEGSMNYSLTKQKNQRWNNTFMLSPHNPFILSDSIYGNPQQEIFSLNAITNYAINHRWNVGLQLTYTSGSRDDQTDPRPFATSMRFMAFPGVSFQLSPTHLLGLNAQIKLFSSSLSHTVIDNQKSTTYFLMRGMGDNFSVNTSDNINYPRRYKGKQWGLSTFWKTHFSHLNNVLEMGFYFNNEVAEDGDAGLYFKGGDHKETGFKLFNRLTFSSKKQLFHSVSFSYYQYNNEGWWYDQRRMVDTEHANRPYYAILHYGMVDKWNAHKLLISYRMDKFFNDNPLWTMAISGELKTKNATHYEADIYQQAFSTYAIKMKGNRFFMLKKCIGEITSQLSYGNTLGSPLFNDVRGILSDAYTRPIFAYNTAQYVSYGGAIKVSFPIKMYHQPSFISVFLRANHHSFLGKGRISEIYNATHRTLFTMGLQLSL